MSEDLLVNKSEQYQMNGAFIGLLLGMAAGLVFLSGLGGAISGGVTGLFLGAIFGTIMSKLGPRTIRFVIGVIIVIIAVALVRNTIEWVGEITTSSQTEFDSGLAEDEEPALIR